MQIAFGRVRRKTSPAIEPAHSPSIAEIASPHAIRVAQSTQRKGSPDSSRQWCMASAISLETSNISLHSWHIQAMSSWFYPLCVACVAYPVEQFTRHIEKDVNIDGTVECLDGASDFLSGAFNSRTRDPIFKDEQGVCDFCVPA